MCRIGGVGTAAARCWVGVPNHETRLSVVQDLVEFRLATCLLLKITFGGDTVAIMSQCGREQSMCRIGAVGKAAARCWVGVPNHETRLSVVQDLVEFRLATCLFLKIVAHFTVFLAADQEQITGQCEWVQSMCRVGMADKATLRTVLVGSNDGSTERRAQNPHRSRPRSISTCAVLLSQHCGCCHCFS